MPIRPATYRDISSISKVFAAAFHDESFHVAFFPHRNQYREDYLRAWRHKITESWWDYQRFFVVTFEIEDGKEVLTGAAQWSKEGEGWEKLWGIKGWWDPRLLIAPIIIYYHKVYRLIFRNRASIQPTPSNPDPLTKWNWLPKLVPLIKHHMIPPAASSNYSTPPKAIESKTSPSSIRSDTSSSSSITKSPAPNAHSKSSPPYYELQILGVPYRFQKRGYGRALAAWGLSIARNDSVPALVVAAEKKENFYQQCGFTNLVGYATEGDNNPLVKAGIRGGAILWTVGGSTQSTEKTGQEVLAASKAKSEREINSNVEQDLEQARGTVMDKDEDEDEAPKANPDSPVPTSKQPNINQPPNDTKKPNTKINTIVQSYEARTQQPAADEQKNKALAREVVSDPIVQQIKQEEQSEENKSGEVPTKSNMGLSESATTERPTKMRSQTAESETFHMHPYGSRLDER